MVTYNLYLYTKYNCHINVEICNSFASVKYLHKYIYKGSDKATLILELSNDNNPISIEFNKNDEIKQYVDAG